MKKSPILETGKKFQIGFQGTSNPRADRYIRFQTLFPIESGLWGTPAGLGSFRQIEKVADAMGGETQSSFNRCMSYFRNYLTKNGTCDHRIVLDHDSLLSLSFYRQILRPATKVPKEWIRDPWATIDNGGMIFIRDDDLTSEIIAGSWEIHT